MRIGLDKYVVINRGDGHNTDSLSYHRVLRVAARATKFITRRGNHVTHRRMSDLERMISIRKEMKEKQCNDDRHHIDEEERPRVVQVHIRKRDTEQGKCRIEKTATVFGVEDLRRRSTPSCSVYKHELLRW